jgi:methylated-DNA-[protein]-cysteine S-methyltransferase
VTPTWDAVWSSPLGRVGVATDAGWLVRIQRLRAGPDQAPADALAAEVVAQLRAWFDAPERGFELPLAPALTAFQARVRAALMALSPGELVTYGALARHLGSSPRAVGAACGANPVPIVVPCHRVVAARGLGGYGGVSNQGEALAFKRGLLALEGAMVPGPGSGG